MNHKELTALIKKISGQANFIGTPRIYVDIFDGDLVAAVWLNQVVYWDGKNKEPIGFYKTYKEWKDELGLSEYQVRRVAKECERRGLVNIMFKKVYGTPKNHYLVVWPELLKVINQTLDTPDPEETKGSESEGTEDEDSSGSMEGQGSPASLSIEETPTKTDIDKEIKYSCIETLQNYSRTIFPDYMTWNNIKRRLQRPDITITGDDKAMVISGLKEKPKGGQFTQAQIWNDNIAPYFAKYGLALRFEEGE